MTLLGATLTPKGQFFDCDEIIPAKTRPEAKSSAHTASAKDVVQITAEVGQTGALKHPSLKQSKNHKNVDCHFSVHCAWGGGR